MPGLGTAGGFKMMLEDQRNLGPHALQAAAWDLIGAASQVPGMGQLFTPFTTGTPSIYADIDRERAEKLGVTPSAVFEAMQVYLGSAYINDFNYLGRTYEVLAQADGRYRNNVEDIAHLKTRNAAGRWCRSAPWRSCGARRIPIACRATTSILPPRCRAARCPAPPRPMGSR